MRGRWSLLQALAVIAGASLVSGAAPCGAENVDAPPGPPEPEAFCASMTELAPSFYSLISADAFSELAAVVEDALSVCTLGGAVVSCSDPRANPPAAGTLLGSLFDTLAEFSSDPAEVTPGAAPGDAGYCAAPGSVPTPENRLCTVRRSLDRLILERTPEGQVILVEAFSGLQPLLADLLRYVDGGFPEVSGPRYGDFPVLRTVSRRCGGDAFVDLLDGFLDWMEPANAARALDAVLALLRNPDAERFLAEIDVENDVGKAGFLALGRLILDTVRSDSFQPAELEQLLEDLVYPFVRDTYPDNDLEGDLRRALSVLTEVLDPAREPSVVAPLRIVLECHATADPDDLLLDMLYDLTVAARAINIDDLVQSLRDLVDVDPQGALVRTLRLLFSELAESEDVRDALAEVIDVALREENARRLVPVTVVVLDGEVVSELVGVADALLGGCRREASSP